MRRALIIAALLVTGAPPVAHAARVGAPTFGATLETCALSPLPAQRIATFVGSMPARAHATRMRMRFDLERRRPGERRWQRLRAPGYGVWERSRPGVAGFVVTKRVTSLPVPASYRAHVRFAWVAADGTTVRAASRHTASCRQLDLRPDIVPGALTATLDLGQPGLATYTLVVRNAGGSAAGPFSVRVGSGSAEVTQQLEAGEERAVPVVAPVCLGLVPIAVVVDADRRVDESDEHGNTALRQCPPPLG